MGPDWEQKLDALSAQKLLTEEERANIGHALEGDDQQIAIALKGLLPHSKGTPAMVANTLATAGLEKQCKRNAISNEAPMFLLLTPWYKLV